MINASVNALTGLIMFSIRIKSVTCKWGLRFIGTLTMVGVVSVHVTLSMIKNSFTD